MGKPDYPTGLDLEDLITAGGITVTNAMRTQFGNTLLAAQTEFEKLTGRQFLAGSATTRYYDPPQGRDRILFTDDMSAAPTAVVYTPTGSTATTLTANTDFRAYPLNALAKGQPYTQLRFLTYRWTLPLSEIMVGSIAVTAAFGYGTSIPEDVWLAILQGAAASGFGVLRFGVMGGIERWSDHDRSVTYGDGAKQLIDAWGSGFQRTVARYRVVRL